MAEVTPPSRKITAADREPVLIDATALQSEHRKRGVGAIVREFIAITERSLGRRPTYLLSTVGEVPATIPTERQLRLWRPHTPAQVYWLYNEAVLRAALLRTRPKLFFAPDFNGLVRNPFGKTVVLLHDLAQLKLLRAGLYRAHGLSERLSDLRWRAYYRKLRHADLLLARSESVRRDAIELLGLAPERIVAVAQGLDHATFRPSFGAGPYRDHGPYFVNVGGFNDNKNQRRILEAFARCQAPEAKLYFAGGWSQGDKAWLVAESARLGVAGRVEHLGYVPDEDLASLYGNATAVVFPSLEEGYGLPVLEGMASGGPVITSNRSSMPEVAGDAALLVDPLEPSNIAAAMQRLYEDAVLRSSLRARGLEHAAHYSWDALTERYWQLFDALLDGVSAASGSPSHPRKEANEPS